MGASAIQGLGHHLPSSIDRAGVRRPIAVDPVGPSELAAPAVRAALGRAGLSEDQVEFLVFATMTPDVTFPGAGCFLQRHLSLGTIGALDVRGQCAGFIYALAIANDFIAAGAYDNVLVVGGEVHSAGLDYSPKGEAVARLFGDGAGAAVIGRAGQGGGALHAAVLGADGRQHDRFWCEYPASRQHPVRFTLENFLAGKHFPAIDFDAVRRFGEAKLPAVMGEGLERAGVAASAIDCFIVSHLFPEIAAAAGAALGAGGARLIVPSADYGHLTAAALPVALSEAVERGQLGSGSTVCLAAAGAGFSWGAAVLTL